MPFIVFEGGNGVGKTTVLQAVAQRLRNKLGEDAVVTLVNPTGGPCGQELRRFLAAQRDKGFPPFFSLDDATHSFAMSLATLFLADRRMMQSELNHWLDKGKTVLCDRYALSTLVFQCAMVGDVHFEGDFAQWIVDGHEGIRDADLTLILDAPMDVSRTRLAAKGENLDDRLMAEIEPAARQMYRAFAKRGRWRLPGIGKVELLNADQPIDVVVASSEDFIEQPPI
jgi:dTMP kinase